MRREPNGLRRRGHSDGVPPGLRHAEKFSIGRRPDGDSVHARLGCGHEALRREGAQDRDRQDTQAGGRPQVRERRGHIRVGGAQDEGWLAPVVQAQRVEHPLQPALRRPDGRNLLLARPAVRVGVAAAEGARPHAVERLQHGVRLERRRRWQVLQDDEPRQQEIQHPGVQEGHRRRRAVGLRARLRDREHGLGATALGALGDLEGEAQRLDLLPHRDAHELGLLAEVADHPRGRRHLVLAGSVGHREALRRYEVCGTGLVEGLARTHGRKAPLRQVLRPDPYQGRGAGGGPGGDLRRRRLRGGRAAGRLPVDRAVEDAPVARLVVLAPGTRLREGPSWKQGVGRLRGQLVLLTSSGSCFEDLAVPSSMF
mmetsp:Transcript_10925/g.29930  ORF Transcript_10925/g.29930 Transcript_10925/m.29930 type:complete len:369 (+) Transcript_10925:191-1297(+)